MSTRWPFSNRRRVMNSRRSRDRYNFFMMALLLTLGCRDLEVMDAAADVSVSAAADRVAQAGLTSGTVIGGGGLRLSVYDAGDAGGPAIVFIYGFTGIYLSWEQQFSGP